MKCFQSDILGLHILLCDNKIYLVIKKFIQLYQLYLNFVTSDQFTSDARQFILIQIDIQSFKN